MGRMTSQAQVVLLLPLETMLCFCMICFDRCVGAPCLWNAHAAHQDLRKTALIVLCLLAVLLLVYCLCRHALPGEFCVSPHVKALTIA